MKFTTKEQLMSHINAGGSLKSLTPNSGFPIGTVAQFRNPTIVGNNVHATLKDTCTAYALTSGVIFYWECSEITRENLLAQKALLLSEIEAIESKIDYLNAAVTDTYSEKEFKVWNVIKTMKKDSLDDYQLAKLVATLV
jgi:hypothetical protein